MNKKSFNSFDAASSFADDLAKEEKWAVDIIPDKDSSSYSVCWIEQKHYTSHSGEVHLDEVWVTAEGEMKCIQDLDAEHARNIIRMLIRNERRQLEAMQDAFAAIASMHDSLEVDTLPDDEEGMPEPTSNRILH